MSVRAEDDDLGERRPVHLQRVAARRLHAHRAGERAQGVDPDLPARPFADLAGPSVAELVRVDRPSRDLGQAERGPTRGVLLEMVVPLDDVPIDQPVRVIKLDVQGAERFVLEGAARRIKADRPFLIVEFEDATAPRRAALSPAPNRRRAPKM